MTAPPPPAATEAAARAPAGPAAPAAGAAARAPAPPGPGLSLREALDQSTGFLALLSPDGVVLDCNAAVLAATGLPAAEVLGLRMPDIPCWAAVPASAAALEADLAAARAGAATRRDALAFRGDGGRTRHAEVGLCPVRDAAGRVARLLADGRDVTDRVAAEAALAAERARLDAVLESLPVGLLVVEAGTGRILHAGARNAELRGGAATSGDMAASLAAFPRLRAETGAPYAPEDLPAARALRGETVRGERFRMRDAEGRWHSMLAHATPVRDAEGRVTAAVATATDVTEQEEMGAALREGEARLALAVRTAALGLAEWDLRTGAFRLDDRAAAICGGLLPAGRWLAPDGPERAAWRAALHPEDLPRRVAARDALAAGDAEAAADEYRFRDPADPAAWRWLASSSAVLEREAGTGRPLRRLDVLADVTERRRAAAALEEGAARLRAAQEAAGIGIFDWDVLADRVVWDDRARALWGVPADRSVAFAAVADAVHPEDRPAMRAAVARALDPAGDGAYAAEYRVVDARDGAVRRVAATGRAEFAGGRAVRLVGTVRDVTAEREAEARVAASEARLRLATEGAGVGTWEVDLTAGRGRRSPEGAALRGAAASAEYGAEEWIAAVHPDDRAAVLAEWRRATGPGGGDRYEVESRTAAPAPDGGERWVLGRGRVERDPATGRALRVAGVLVDVTARRRAEAELRASEERFRSFAEASADAIYIVDAAARRLEYLSPAYERIWGEPRDAMMADLGRWDALLHPEDRARAAAEQRRLYEDPDAGPVTAEYRVVRAADGAVRHIRDIAVPVRDPATGRIVRVAGIAHDATERRAAEAAARAALGALEAVYRTAPVGLCVLDTELRWTRINARLAEINGFPPEAHLGRRLRDLIPAVADGLEPALRRVLETGEPWLGVEVRGETPARPGAPRVWEAGFLPFRDPETGRVAGINVVAEEVTERRAAARALAEGEGRFRALAEAVPAIVWEAGPDGRLVWVSPAWADYTGLPAAAAAPGAPPADWSAAVHPEDRARSAGSWADAVARGEGYAVEERIRGRDGAHRWFLTRAVPQRGPDGAALRWLGTSADIQEMVAAREALARDNAALEALVERRTDALRGTVRRLEEETRRREADQAALVQAQKLEAMGQLVGGVAHDFNNLLMAISGSLELLGRRLPAEAGEGAAPARRHGTAEILRQGRDAAGRAAGLVRQLLAFARREALRPAPLDPATLAEPVAGLLRAAVGPRVEVSAQVAPGTPPVLVDRQQLEVALLNLAVNARDAMPGGGRLAVSVGPEPGTEMVAFAVEDTGEGMDAAVLARAREPFFTTKPLGKGTGLGLAMVHGFAGQSGGSLRLDSAPGRGTRATILLPRLTEAGAALLAGAAAAEAGPPPALDRARHGGATILLVEDDPAVRPVTAAFLRDLGYGVLEAPGAEAAYAVAVTAEEPIHLVVTDVMMPGEDGPALAARLRAERPELPVLFVTGHADRERLGPGAAVLDKPFTQDALAARVLAALGR